MTRFIFTIFFTFLTLPLSVLLFFQIEPYGQRPFKNVPKIKSIAAGLTPDNIKKLLDAAFERSIVTRESISLKNTFRYQMFGDLDSSTTIQGYDGWLFFKGQFKNGNCYKRNEVRSGVNGVDLLHKMAKEVGLDITIGVSPNKSSIYPEKLNQRFSKFYRCLEKNSREIDQAFVERFDFVKSAKPILLAAKEQGLPIYYPTDTHWTDVGAILATYNLPGLIKEETVDWNKIRLNLRYKERENDLSNLMALVGRSTKVDSISRSYVEEMLLKQELPYSYLIGDSFMRQTYNLEALGNIDFYQTNWGTKTLVKKIQSADGPILLDSVEREFISRTVKGYLSPKGDVMKGILARHEDHFLDVCEIDSDPILPVKEIVMRSSKVTPNNNDFEATTDDPQHFITLNYPLSDLCVSITVNTKRSGVMEVYFPIDVPMETIFANGRSIPIILDSNSSNARVNLILPSNLTTNTIRIDPINFKGAYQIEEILFYKKKSRNSKR